SRCRRRGCPTRSPLTPLRRNGLDLLRCEEEAMAGPALLAQVAARILLQGDREVDAVFIVLLDRLDEGHLAGQRDVHDVGARARVKPHLAPLADLGPVYHDAAWRRPIQRLEQGRHLTLTAQHPELTDRAMQLHEIL